MERAQKQLDLKRVAEILFESAAEGLVVADKEGGILMANPRTYEMFGYDRGDLVGKQVEILIPQRHRKGHIGHRKKYNHHPSKRSMGVGMNLSAVRKDGSEFPVEVSLNHFSAEGQMLIMALISDITERRKMDERVKKMNVELEERVRERTLALEESQQLYRIIARNFPNGTINVFDKDLNYVFAEGMEMYKIGITSEKLVGTSYLARISPQVRDDIRARLLAVFKGKNASFEVKLKDRTYLITAVGLHDSKGEINQLLVVEQNVTRFKKAEEDIRNALRKEQQLNELKSRFVSMASHEFRTPLTSVLSSVSLLAKYIEKGDSQKREKHLSRIRTSVHSLTDILNEFLSLDKLEQGNLELHFAEVDIEDYVRLTVEEMQEIATKGQRIDYYHTGPELVVQDRQMLKTIFHNLLSNAIKYSPPDTVIDLSTSVAGGKLTISVSDEGIGIPEEEQDHLFERFFRAKNALNIQGTGLGLSIIQKYLDITGGSIKFESKEGKGTTFIVKLPAKMTPHE